MKQMKTPTQFPTFSVSRRRFPSTFLAGLGSALLLAITPTDGQAGSSTWNLSPISTDWNTAANWNPATVPNGPNDIASFGFSNQPAVVLSANTSVSSLIYNADAISYNTTVPTGITLTVNDGITNNSAVAQGFVIDHGSLVFNFESGGSAGELTNYFLNGSGSTLTFSSGLASPNETYTIEGGGQILFNNSSAASFRTAERAAAAGALF
jgi:hypothetical protein